MIPNTKNLIKALAYGDVNTLAKIKSEAEYSIEMWNCTNEVYSCQDNGLQLTEQAFNQYLLKHENSKLIFLSGDYNI